MSTDKLTLGERKKKSVLEYSLRKYEISKYKIKSMQTGNDTRLECSCFGICSSVLSLLIWGC